MTKNKAHGAEQHLFSSIALSVQAVNISCHARDDDSVWFYRIDKAKQHGSIACLIECWLDRQKRQKGKQQDH